MAIRNLRFNSDPILRKRCREVTEVDDKVRSLLDDMMDTLHNTKNAAALAANQVGILRRLVVIDFGGARYQLVNPTIVKSSGKQECVEGCLSFPGRFLKTIRPQKVIVSALDRHGRKLLLAGEGELAKCFCHELEHLDGILFTDHAIGVAHL